MRHRRHRCVFMDDVRAAPRGWKLARRVEDCITVLAAGDVYAVSLDHDMGEGLDGMDLVRWLCGQPAAVWPDVVIVHSMNWAAGENMAAKLFDAAPEGCQVLCQPYSQSLHTRLQKLAADRQEALCER